MTTTNGANSSPSHHGRALWLYFAGAFLWTWAFWVPAALAERGTLAPPVSPTVLQILGGLGPLLAAVVLAARGGGDGVRVLIRQLRLRGLSRRWVVAAFAVGLLDLFPALVYLATGGSLPPGIAGQLAIMPIHFLFVAILGGGLDEEVGWRGFALPRLQQQLSPVTANLLLGVLWACWHLPLWLSPDGSHAATPFAVYLATVLGQSFVIGWLYNASGGSLLVAVIVHSSADVADGLRFAVLDGAGWDTTAALLQMLAMVTAAITLTVATRGRLGVDAPPLLPAAHPDTAASEEDALPQPPEPSGVGT